MLHNYCWRGGISAKSGLNLANERPSSQWKSIKNRPLVASASRYQSEKKRASDANVYGKCIRTLIFYQVSTCALTSLGHCRGFLLITVGCCISSHRLIPSTRKEKNPLFILDTTRIPYFPPSRVFVLRFWDFLFFFALCSLCSPCLSFFGS